jgi:SARP family transcriptional regulator, regulator of embCAB operon
MESSDGPALRIALLGGFRLLTKDDHVTISGGSERLLAFISLCGRAVPRVMTAGTLWPDVQERQAYASLRSALARLEDIGRRILEIGSTEIRLSSDVDVDIHTARSLARRILDPTMPTDDRDLTSEAVTALSNDLLPGWYDDWALLEAEEWHQLRLHALEALSGEFVAAGRYADAVAAAGMAVRAEPLRESAYAALIRAHLAEGNQADALRDFERCEQFLHAQLGLRPTEALYELIAGLRTVTRR